MATSSAGLSAPDGSNGEPGSWPRTPEALERLATGVFVALVLGSFAAFFVIQALKHAPKPIRHPKVQPSFAPSQPGPKAGEQITFELAKAGAVTVAIVDSHEKLLRTLVADRPVPADTALVLDWNGLTNSGAPAPAGTYEVLVKLLSQNLEVRLPESFSLSRPAETGQR